jgi:hypothetical protein
MLISIPSEITIELRVSTDNNHFYVREVSSLNLCPEIDHPEMFRGVSLRTFRPTYEYIALDQAKDAPFLVPSSH